MTAQDVVLDTSALVVYAENDLHGMAIDELIREVRTDTGGRVFIPWFALEDAQWILRDSRDALDRLQDLTAEFGIQLADANVRRGVEEVAAKGHLTAGMAHAILLAVQADCAVATYAASTLRGTGFKAINDLDAIFPFEP